MTPSVKMAALITVFGLAAILVNVPGKERRPILLSDSAQMIAVCTFLANSDRKRFNKNYPSIRNVALDREGRTAADPSVAQTVKGALKKTAVVDPCHAATLSVFSLPPVAPQFSMLRLNFQWRTK
jgi:hypothetical protein